MTGLSMQMLSENEASALHCTLPSQDIADRLMVMRHQELTYGSADYIDHSCQSLQAQHSDPQNRPVDQECRVKMCEWCYQVTDFCKFRRETVAISMSYLDRFLSSRSPRARRAVRDRKEYQLAAMTCLFVAVKMFEPMEMDASLLSAISRGCYDQREIIEMEQEILTSLQWKMNGPTSHDFLNYFIMLLPSSGCNATAMTLLDFSRYQIEIAVGDYQFALQRPSVVAMAAILNSIEGIDSNAFGVKSRFDYLHRISQASEMNLFCAEINRARIRLLALFERNSGYELPQVANLTPILNLDEEFITPKSSNKISLGASPVSVTSRILTRRGSAAKCA